MNLLNNKTIRVSGTDIVSTEIFNQVFSSLDRTVFTIDNIEVSAQNPGSWTFQSSLTNNINVFISIRAVANTVADIKINYQNQSGPQEYVLLQSFNLDGPETYIFNPVFFSISQNTSVTLTANSTSQLYISASAIIA